MTTAVDEQTRSAPLIPVGLAHTADEYQATLRVGLLGFGRTGREVAAMLLREESMRLEWVVRRTDRPEHRSVPEYLGVESEDPGVIRSARDLSADELLATSPVDVIIDFSSDTGLDYYGRAAASHRTAIVSAISRYSDGKRRELLRLSARTSILWSPNITLGINFMLLAAQTLQRIAPQADVQIVEEHFREKPGVSGTALRLAQALGMPEDTVHVIRAGGIIGVHEILFGFPAQTVRLRHEAISREAFGHGAIFAAKQITGRGPGLYRMEDILLPYFADRRGDHARPPCATPGLRGRLASRLRAAAQRLDRTRS